MAEKSKFKLNDLKVKSFVTLPTDETQHIKAGGLVRTETCPITDSWHYKSCGPECTYQLTMWCDMSYWC